MQWAFCNCKTRKKSLWDFWDLLSDPCLLHWENKLTATLISCQLEVPDVQFSFRLMNAAWKIGLQDGLMGEFPRRHNHQIPNNWSFSQKNQSPTFIQKLPSYFSIRQPDGDEKHKPPSISFGIRRWQTWPISYMWIKKVAVGVKLFSWVWEAAAAAAELACWAGKLFYHCDVTTVC